MFCRPDKVPSAETKIKDFFDADLKVHFEQQRLTWSLYRLLQPHRLSEILLQGCHLSGKSLEKIKPAFKKVIKTRIRDDKDYLAYFVCDG